MKIRCEYCDNFISDTDETCPHCGAPNAHLQRSAAGVPKTIGELRDFAAAHRLPLEKMRFFLGTDCREPRAYGIYQDEDGLFVVYKNKSDGTRAVRYRGKDEAYAVNELWQKMRSEVQLQKSSRPASRTAAARQTKRKFYQRPGLIVLAVFLALTLLGGIVDRFTPDTGYYQYDGGYYYYDSDDWYLYDDASNDWYETDVGIDSPLYSSPDDYYTGYGYQSDASYGSFYDGSYSDDSYSGGSYSGSSDDDSWSSSWDSSWDDDDWDWDDGDDWDSGYSDWDSDW